MNWMNWIGNKIKHNIYSNFFLKLLASDYLKYSFTVIFFHILIQSIQFKILFYSLLLKFYDSFYSHYWKFGFSNRNLTAKNVKENFYQNFIINFTPIIENLGFVSVSYLPIVIWLQIMSRKLKWNYINWIKTYFR